MLVLDASMVGREIVGVEGFIGLSEMVREVEVVAFRELGALGCGGCGRRGRVYLAKNQSEIHEGRDRM
jgi:hypothetical protein